MKITLAKEIIENYTIKIDNLKIFDDNEIEILTTNLKIIYLLNDIHCYFKLVEMNFVEFEQQLTNDTVNLLKFSKSPLKPNEELLNEVMINMNRLLINYLTSYRTVIDHLPRLLNIDQREKLKKYISEIFDNNFEYRFLDQLRNFAQHRNLPINDFACEADVSSAKVFYFINIKTILSQKYDWRAETKKEMNKYNKIDSLSIVSAHYELMKKIKICVFQLFKSDFELAVSFFDELNQKFSGDYKLILLHNNEDLENIPNSMINNILKDFK